MNTKTLLLAALLPCIFVAATVSARAEIPPEGLTLEEAFSEPPAKAKDSKIPLLIPLEPGNKIHLWRPLDPGEVVIPPKGMKLEDLHIVTPSKRDPRVPYHHSTFEVYRPEPGEPLLVSRPVPHDYAGAAVPVLPIGADQIDTGTVYGNVYNVYDKAGKNYSGVVVGDSDYSITYPMGKGDPVMRSGNMIINLGR